MDQARELVQSKTTEIRKIAKASSQEAWDKSIKEVSPYLDKVPEIKQLLNDNASTFIAAGATSLTGASSSTQELFSRIKEAAQGDALKNKEKMNELGWPLRDYIVQIARFDPSKGIPNVIDSYARFRKLMAEKQPDIEPPQMLICGHGASMTPMRASSTTRPSSSFMANTRSTLRTSSSCVARLVISVRISHLL